VPYKSKSQERFFFAAEARGDMPKGTARRWAHHTKSIKALPEHVGHGEKKSSVMQDLDAGLEMLFGPAAQAKQAAGGPLSLQQLGPIPYELRDIGSGIAEGVGQQLKHPQIRADANVAGA
jgi:hypothetical protein